MSRTFEIRRFATGLTSWLPLCDLHVQQRKIVGYRFLKEKATTAACADCEAAKQPTVLDVAVASDPDLRRLDKQNEPPEPVPVLSGQRSLFE